MWRCGARASECSLFRSVLLCIVCMTVPTVYKTRHSCYILTCSHLYANEIEIRRALQPLLLPEPRLVKRFKGEAELAKKESETEKKSSMAGLSASHGLEQDNFPLTSHNYITRRPTPGRLGKKKIACTRSTRRAGLVRGGNGNFLCAAARRLSRSIFRRLFMFVGQTKRKRAASKKTGRRTRAKSIRVTTRVCWYALQEEVGREKFCFAK